ncbi:MAG: glycoside hydrolase family 31 protein [Saprospiraceae bacterium]
MNKTNFSDSVANQSNNFTAATSALSQSKMININQTSGFDRYPDVYTDFIPDSIISIREVKDQQYLIRCENNLALELTFYSDEIVRFRYAPKGYFERDFSYAIKPELKQKFVAIQHLEDKESVTFCTKHINIQINKKNLTATIVDDDGEVICADAQPFFARQTINKGTIEVKIVKQTQNSEAFYGLGDKCSDQNIRGQSFQNWCTDAFGFHKNYDPQYKAIPFYYGTHAQGNYGIFLDNTFRSHFDFDSEKKGEVTISAEGGEMNYYFIYGKNLTAVAENYTHLTGVAELPPLWALGYHQCRWSYFPDVRVKEVADTFRKLEIPCDAIYLDIDYMNGYRCFTWNQNYFPEPKQLVDELSELGFHTVVMIDPGIKEDNEYAVFTEGIEKGMFCQRMSGDVFFGPVWPQNCAFPDFTDANVRDWWGQLYKNLYLHDEVSGFWNDMNEPAVFKIEDKTFPPEILHNFDGAPCDHTKAHNIYGMQMARASYEGLKNLKPYKRPFLLTRAIFSGGQRFASVWTGDNAASWEHLRYANIQAQRLSISGFSLVGSDIGGFIDTPTPELYTRWLQLAVFHPIMRTHTMGNHAAGDASDDDEVVLQRDKANRKDQEPWSFGEESTKINKKVIGLRYQLLPYTYTAFRQHQQQGTPIIRPLSFYDEQDENCKVFEDQFLYGNNIIVCPVLEKNQQELTVYLPKGNWYHYHTGAKYEGGKKHTLKLSLEYIPFFVKAGTVLPQYPVIQHTSCRDFDTLSLNYYWDNQPSKSELYEDDGEGYQYLQKQYCLKTFNIQIINNQLVIKQNTVGHYRMNYQNIQLTIWGNPNIQQIIVDDKPIDFQKNENSIVLRIQQKFKTILLH